MPPEGFLVQPCPTAAYQAQPQAMQGIHMRPWPVQDSQAQLHTPQVCQGQPLSAQGYQAQPLPAQGGPAQLQGILTGKSKGSADLLNCALADLLEPETPEQFEAELFEDMFSLLPEGEDTVLPAVLCTSLFTYTRSHLCWRLYSTHACFQGVQ